MIKTRSNCKLCDEDIIPKSDHLIATCSFIVVFNKTTFSFFYRSQSITVFFIANSSFFFIATTKQSRPLYSFVCCV
jgi:hypothetical protein